MLLAALLVSACGADPEVADPHTPTSTVGVAPPSAAISSPPPVPASSAPAPPANLTVPTTIAAPLPARAVIAKDGALRPFDLSTSELGEVLLDTGTVSMQVVPVPHNSGSFDALISTMSGNCQAKLVRMSGDQVSDLGVSGFHGHLSGDHGRLAFVASRPHPDAPDRCEWTLVVRDLSTAQERRWSFGDSGFGGLEWGADNRTLYFVPAGEGFGPLVSLNTAIAPEGFLTNAVAPVRTGLRDHEWFGVPTQITSGVFVRIMCKQNGVISSFVPPCGIGILTNEGLQRVETAMPPESIRAVDPTGMVVIYDELGKTYASLIDGSRRRPINTGGNFVYLY